MKRILLSSALLLFALVSFAQRPGKDKIKAQKTAFITNNLELTSQEAELFWPVYNRFEKREMELRKKFKNIKRGKPSSDEEANQMILEKFELDTQLLDLKREKLAALREVISPTKIVMLAHAERKFKKRMIKAIRKGKNKRKQK